MSLNLEAILELLKQHVSPAAQRVPKGWEIIAREAHRQGVIDGRAIQMESAVHCDAAGASEGQAEPVAWTLQCELDAKESTYRAHLWFVDPRNTSWTALYTHPSAEIAALRKERDQALLDAEQARNERNRVGVEIRRELMTEASALVTALRERIAGMEKAITPFVDAFEEIHARSYEGADAQFAAFLDRNTVTPSMTVGDFRRLRDAAIAKEKQQ